MADFVAGHIFFLLKITCSSMENFTEFSNEVFWNGGPCPVIRGYNMKMALHNYIGLFHYNH